VRLTSQQAKQNRQLILETASRMFRLHGIENVSVADIMKQSGFTHGGFYNHFKSKQELAAEAVACSFEKSAHGISEKFALGKSPQKPLEMVIAEYLSPAYRDSSTGGCPASALPADAARNGREVQTAFALVGVLMFSRAVKQSNPKLSDELLSSARKHLCR